MLFAGLTVAAQEVTGTISGTVVDTSGASIPNANVTITNTSRNQVASQVTTSLSGEFTAPLLPLGTYSVAVEVNGFKKLVQQDIVLHVNDKLNLHMELQVGGTSEQVTVEANAIQVETQSPTTASLISGIEIRELSLNNRNYTQLINLMPGVTNNSVTDENYIGTTNPLGSTNTIPFSLNGGRTSGSNFMVDGADNVDRGSNLTLLTYPSVDAIAEFRALTAGYSAEFGRAASGQINVITKSGTSDFHGGAYEFNRNDKLAANNFFNNSKNLQRPPLRYNNFGYTIGGPVYIPGHYNKDKNKTFFFFSEEFRRVITYSTLQSTVPSADMKNGIFSTPVCTQANAAGTACAQTASTIPASSFNPVAKQYIDNVFSHVPTGDANNTLYSPFRSVFNARQELVRLDHAFTSNLNAFVRYEHDSIPTEEPGGLFTGSGVPGVANTKTKSPGQSLVTRGTWSIRPTLIAEFGYAYSYGAITSEPTGLDGTAYGSIKTALPYPVTLSRIPGLTFSSGVSSITGYGPYKDYNRNHNFSGSLTKIYGHHTIKAGGQFNMYQKKENAAGNNVGNFTFTNALRPVTTATGSVMQSWANFLLGNVSSFSQASLDLTPDMRQKQWESFVQDDWRITSSLTLNFGVRYSMFYQPWDNNHMLTNFDPALWQASAAPQVTASGNLVPNTGNLLNGIIQNGVNSPHGDKMTGDGNGNWAPRVGFAWDPTKKGLMAIRGGYGISYDSTLVGIFEQNIFNNPPYVSSVTIPNTNLSDPASGTASVSLAPKVLRGTPSPSKTPYTQQWSFDIQRQLGRNTLIDVGYVGSKSTHLLGIVDMNMVQPGAAVAAGITTPTAPLTSATEPKLNAIRPYRGYNAINSLENWFNSNYHSLQTSVQQKLGGNSSIRMSYTFGKTLTDATSDRSNAPQNYYARNLDYARANFDRTHVATISYIYALPFMKNQTGLAASIVHGWQVSGIATFQSGLATRVTSGLGYDWGDTGIIGSSAASPRPDMVCNPNSNAPHTVQAWFNTSCFAPVPAGVVRPGNAPATSVNGPGTSRFDTSLFRTVALKEKVSLQLRFETFNTFNHTNYLAFGTSLGTSTFGQVTSAREPRRIQVGAKLNF